MFNRKLVVREHTVPLADWPAELAGLRVAHVSDFHFRRWNGSLTNAQRILMEREYDLLLVTGDFGTVRSRWRHAAEMARRFFDPIADSKPIYSVLGNHDDPQLATTARLPLTFLRDQSLRVVARGAPLRLAGVEQVVPRGSNLDRALDGEAENLPTILLAHYPSTVFRLPPRRVQLQLSGHTHGGQIRLPFLGCLWPNDLVPRHMARGLHNVNGTFLHVSAGLGASFPLPARINCAAELSILTLVPAHTTIRKSDLTAPRKFCRPQPHPV